MLKDSEPLICIRYVKLLYLQPIYQKKLFWAYENIVYSLGICPIAEQIHLIKYSII